MSAVRTRTTVYSSTTPRKPRVPVTPSRPVIREKPDKDVRSDKKETVGVYLRLRPLKQDQPTLVKIDDQQVKAISPDGSSPQIFSFTQVFDGAAQSEIFDKVARPVVEDFIISAKDGLIFTYGITGSGKTYTMEGLNKDPGLVYRTIDFLFNSIGTQQTPKSMIEGDRHNSYYIVQQEHFYPSLGRSETQAVLPSLVRLRYRVKESAKANVNPTKSYCVFISLVELYNKQVHDLFEDLDVNSTEKEKKRREIRTDHRGMSFVANVVELEVKSADEAVELYTRGVRRRKIGATALNQESSRGHCVLTLKLIQTHKLPNGELDKNSLVASQLCLVDLAGSERAKRSGATGGALHEACNINNSLGALRKCIRALRDREPTSNIQYRDYSLTRLFKSYFEGYGSVRMVLCVKPTSEDFQENNIAMEFGLLTQHVAIDYASPPKMLKRSAARTQETNYAAMYEYFNKKMTREEPDPDLNDEMYITTWIERLKSNRERRKKYIEAALGAQMEVRKNILSTMTENEALKQKYDGLMQFLGKMKTNEWTGTAPSAPEMEPMHSSSPVQIPSSSTIGTSDSNTPPTTTNSSTEVIEFQDNPQTSPRSPAKQLLSPTSGVPVINPRHNRSLSCSNMQWIHHKPQGTIDTGTVLKPKFKNGRSVRNLRSSDILRKDAAGYSVVHQDADSNGEVETSVYKGHIISTVCGGAQVILNDIETMRQASPKRKRAASDAHFTH